MQVFMRFRSYHIKLCPEDIKGRICLVVREDKQQFISHRWQFAFGATARCARARSGHDPFFIRLLLRGLVDVAEDGQQVGALGVGEAREGFHLTIISDLQPHWLAPSIAFWEDSLPDYLLGNNSIDDTYIALFSHFIACGVWEAV